MSWTVDDLDEVRAYWATLAGKNPLNASSLVYGLINDLEDLRARLAEVEAERDDALADFTDMRDGVGRFAGEGGYFDLKARLAEVEAERDERAKDAIRAQRGWGRALDRAEAAEAEIESERLARIDAENGKRIADEDASAAESRLAAVLALCDETDRHPEPNAGVLHTSQIRAAARGDGDRG